MLPEPSPAELKRAEALKGVEPKWDAAPIGQDGRPMRAGQRGFHINCAHCRKEFESLGSRCCSVECERLHRDGVKIGKRRCSNCDMAIPTWRKGRRVSSKTRFCSPKCAKAASRVSDTREAILSANT